MDNNSKINIDFTQKINNHFINVEMIDDRKTKAINEFLIFLSFCFTTKNNFFVENFNRKSIGNIKNFHSKLKTNILLRERYTTYIMFFNKMNLSEIKCLIFLINNYIYNIIVKHEDKDKHTIYVLMINLLNEAKKQLEMEN